MKKSIIIMLFACLAAFGAAAAAAEDVRRAGLSIGGRAAYLEPDNNNAGDGQLHGGAQARIGLGEVISVEGSADYRQAQFRGLTLDIYPVQASLLAYILPGKPVSPFILAGAGWYFTSVRNGGTDNRFGPHAGAGIDVRFHENWSIDATYRYVWIDDVNNVGDLPNASFQDRGHMGTVGLNFHF